MTLSNNTNDREKAKFRDTSQGAATAVAPNGLKIINGPDKYDVDTTAVKIFDHTDTDNAKCAAIKITNAGTGKIYLYTTSSVASDLCFQFLGAEESWEFPWGDLNNDIYAIRASDEADDNVIVVIFGEA